MINKTKDYYYIVVINEWKKNNSLNFDCLPFRPNILSSLHIRIINVTGLYFVETTTTHIIRQLLMKYNFFFPTTLVKLL
jgi:hypothetical protein